MRRRRGDEEEEEERLYVSRTRPYVWRDVVDGFLKDDVDAKVGFWSERPLTWGGLRGGAAWREGKKSK